MFFWTIFPWISERILTFRHQGPQASSPFWGCGWADDGAGRCSLLSVSSNGKCLLASCVATYSMEFELRLVILQVLGPGIKNCPSACLKRLPCFYITNLFIEVTISLLEITTDKLVSFPRTRVRRGQYIFNTFKCSAPAVALRNKTFEALFWLLQLPWFENFCYSSLGLDSKWSQVWTRCPKSALSFLSNFTWGKRLASCTTHGKESLLFKGLWSSSPSH